MAKKGTVIVTRKKSKKKGTVTVSRVDLRKKIKSRAPKRRKVRIKRTYA